MGNIVPRTICIWPDGLWCDKRELNEYLTFRSDDVIIHEVEENLSADEIDSMAHCIANKRNQNGQ
jgi:hypothetical protein